MNRSDTHKLKSVDTDRQDLGGDHNENKGTKEVSGPESNSAIASILENISDAFVAIDTGFYLRYINLEAERLLGKPRREMLDNSIYELFPEFVGSVFDREYKRAMSYGIKVNFEAFYEPFGAWFDVHAYPSPEGLAIYFRDVTERHRADEELRTSNERFQLAQRAANMTTWDWNMKTGEVSWSSNAGSVYDTGGDRFNLAYEAWIEVMLPEDRPQVERSLRDALERKADYDTEYRIRTADGKIRWLAARGQIHFDENDIPQRMLGVNIDITARKEAEEALRASEETYRSLFETMTQGVIYSDGFGHITSTNRAAEEILGVSAEELRGRSIDCVWNAIRENGTAFPGSMHPALVALETGHEVKNVIVGVYNSREEEHRWIKVDAVPQFRPGEMFPYQVYTMFDDITERKRSQEILRVSERLAATGRLAASIAHEINNPLESITNLLYLLEHDESLQNPARQYAAMAQQELMRVTHIARQTLGFYRDTSSPVPVSIPLLLDNVLELYRRKIESKSLTVTCAYDIDEQIRAFPGELRQVFSNLIINAIESVPQGGRVRVHVFGSREPGPRKSRGIRVTVADSGPGIPVEHRKKIFEPFFTTKGEKGTGLGLWVSNGIIEKHGGSIRFRSSTSARHSGTVFSVYLPYREHRAQTGVAA